LSARQAGNPRSGPAEKKSVAATRSDRKHTFPASRRAGQSRASIGAVGIPVDVERAREFGQRLLMVPHQVGPLLVGEDECTFGPQPLELRAKRADLVRSLLSGAS